METTTGRRRIGVLAGLALLLPACGGVRGDDLESVRSSLGIAGFPQGLTCGLAYKTGGGIVRNGTCNNVPTLGGSPATGYRIVFDGDVGLPAGTGFSHQAYGGDPGIDPNTNSDQLLLPKGTACGFKHTCNSRGETCLGRDPGAGHCPKGWLPRSAADIKAPGGCNFAWCEYQDTNGLCTSEACLFSQVPMGIACGITDSDSKTGQCLGVKPAQPPAGVARCGGAPNNDYYFDGFYDAGRASGHGIGFCSRLTHADYHNGPVMSAFTIYPVFYGNWPANNIIAQEMYLNGLAGYIDGTGAPYGKSPFIRQYGVNWVTVAPSVTYATRKTMPSDADIRGYIGDMQGKGILPQYASNILIMFFPGPGMKPNSCGLPGADSFCDGVWWGYHASVSSTGFYGVVFLDLPISSITIATSHEVFEAATDPNPIFNGPAWSAIATAPPEICDYCAGAPAGTAIIANGVAIQECFDNSLFGACNSTGYITNPPASSECGRLLASRGEGLVAGGPQATLTSCLGGYDLAMQTDGNLVLYDNKTGIALWASNTYGKPNVTAILQPDGNFVLNRGFGYYGPDVSWATGTNPLGTKLYVQDDGNLVVYGDSGFLWASNTAQP